jgi:acyl-CoA thioesterase FadM
VNKLLRTLWLLLVSSRRRSRLGILDVAHTPFRVRPTDIDILRHMNNGVYLSMADLGRFDLLIRSGVWETFNRLGWYPVVANQTISYRKSLDLWTKYDLQSKLVGADARGIFVEQRFVVNGEIYAQMVIRGRFLKRSGGTVTIDELNEATGVDVRALEVPEWILRWAADAALPTGREPARSDWA